MQTPWPGHISLERSARSLIMRGNLNIGSIINSNKLIEVLTYHEMEGY